MKILHATTTGLFVLTLVVASIAAQAPPAKLRMATYYLVLLRPGRTLSAVADSNVEKRIFEGHMAHLKALGNSHKLVTAGPIAKSDNLEGILILDVKTLDAAKAAVGDDPAVKTGRLAAEYYEWFAPAGLQVVQAGVERRVRKR